jgi:4-amino-4-deoxy-L-arabinose transferase-like glycosyltransferase
MTAIRSAIGGRGGRIVALVAVIALATGLRLALLDRQGLWADEVFSLAIATGHSLEHPAVEADPAQGDYVEAPTPLPASDFKRYLDHEDPPAGFHRVLRAVRLSDTSPPLYYLLLNGWTRWAGVSDASIRFLSVLWAMASMPILWLIARRVGGETAALPAAVLFAVCPLGLYYSVETRMYSLLVFLVISMVALTLALRTEDAKLWLVGPWAAVSAAALLTHYFACFAWVACLAWLAVTPGRIRRTWVAGGAVMTALLVLPWYVVVPESLGRWRVTGYWLYEPVSLLRALSLPFWLVWTFVSGDGAWQSGHASWHSSTRSQWIAALAFGAVALALALGLRRRLFSGDRGLVWLWVAAACIGPLVFDLMRGTSTAARPRYALAGLPGVLILAAVGLSRLRLAMRVVVLLAILLAWSSGLRTIARLPSREYEPYRDVAVRLSASVAPEDLVLVHSIPSGVLGIARYMSPATMVASWVGQLGERRVPADAEALTEGRAKVIVVRIHDVGEPAPEDSWLRVHARLVGESEQQGARLSAYEPRSGERFTWRPARGDPPRPDGR